MSASVFLTVMTTINFTMLSLCVDSLVDKYIYHFEAPDKAVWKQVGRWLSIKNCLAHDTFNMNGHHVQIIISTRCAK